MSTYAYLYLFEGLEYGFCDEEPYPNDRTMIKEGVIEVLSIEHLDHKFIVLDESGWTPMHEDDLLANTFIMDSLEAGKVVVLDVLKGKEMDCDGDWAMGRICSTDSGGGEPQYDLRFHYAASFFQRY